MNATTWLLGKNLAKGVDQGLVAPAGNGGACLLVAMLDDLREVRVSPTRPGSQFDWPSSLLFRQMEFLGQAGGMSGGLCAV